VVSQTSSSYDGEQERAWGPAEPAAQRGDQLAAGYQVVVHMRRGHRLDVYDLWSLERGARCVGKTLRPERAGDEVAAARLRTEGMLLETLTHPHLVRGYETVLTSERPRPLVVIETLPGRTVSHLLGEHGRLSAGDAAMLGVQLCSVLGYLHRHEWVHLDVKPANVVELAGRAVLLDLSMACRRGERSTGGTFDYLSPEQARGDPVSEAADVWGLGITLHEVVSGATPWSRHSHRRRGSADTRRYPQLEERVPPLRRRRRLPPALSELVHDCLDPSPTARPTIDEITERLVAMTGVDPRTAER
jgi:eukaryotic-like serine/threonine-protein kinase